MNELVYPRERTLGAITLALGILVWIGLILGTFGVVLIVIAVLFVLSLFAHSGLIAYIKGDGVKLSEAQFPDLHAQFIECCDRLQMKKRPEAFILNGNGGMNAFATKFLRTQYVVLMSDVVDAMSTHADGVRFYMGHELGHLRMKHLSIGHLLRFPVLWLPLLGSAYSRACESTCDRHGLACSGSPEGAARALAALATGAERWKDLDMTAYISQTRQTTGFWMSFHELIASYPWLTKRAARVMDTKAPMPKRNPFAYILALFVPYAGRMGAAFGLLIMIYVLFILAAIAVPMYQNYVVKAKVNSVVIGSQSAREALGNYYSANEESPDSLEELGLQPQLADGSQMSLDPDNMELTVTIKQGAIIFTPSVDEDGQVSWECTNGEPLKPTQLSPSCQNLGN